MTRKFFFCFPLRLGNIIFGYIVLMFTIAVIAYNLYQLGLSIVTPQKFENDDKFKNWERLENIFGERKETLVSIVTMIYYLSYIVIAFLMLICSAIYTCGAYKANNCMVSTFFVYSFVHLFLTIGLIVWEATSGGWIQLGIIAGSDLVLIVCLFSVKYLMEAIQTGHIYSRPGEVYYKY